MAKCLEHSTLEQREDRDYVIQSFRCGYGQQLRYASRALRNDEDVVKVAIRAQWENFVFASLKLRGNKEIASLVAKSIRYDKDSWIFKYMGAQVLDEYEVISLAIKNAPTSLQYVSPRLQNQEELVLDAVEVNPSCLQYASAELRGKEKVVIAAARGGLKALKYVAPELLNNKEVMTSIINVNIKALHYIGKELAGDEKFIAGLISHNPLLLQDLPGIMKNSKLVVFHAIIKNIGAWQYASREIRDDLALSKIKDCLGNNFIDWFKQELDCDHNVPLEIIQMLGMEDEMMPEYLQIHRANQNEEAVAADLEVGRGIDEAHSDL